MRITLLLLAAGFSVAASGAAAAAEIARGSMVRSGGHHGGWKPGGFGHGVKHWRPSRPHPGRGHWRHERRRGHHWGPDRTVVHSYGGGGLDYSYEAVDPHGSGFFAGGGGEVSVRGGRPHYDYDRSYPYEWASSAAGAGRGRADEEEGRPAPVHCGVESGVRVCRGGR